jgi:hypothetical protein
MLTNRHHHRLAASLLAIATTGLGCAAAPESTNEAVVIDTEEDGKADGTTLRFREREPNDSESSANLIDSALEFGKMTKLRGSLKDWDDDYFQITNLDDRTIVYGYLIIDKDIRIDFDYETGIGTENEDEYNTVMNLDGVHYFQFRNAGTARIHLMSIAAEHRHDYVLMLGKLQVEGPNPAHVVVAEDEGFEGQGNDDWPNTIDVVPNFWTELTADLDYETFDRDMFRIPLHDDWVLYGSTFDSDESDEWRRFEVEIWGAKTNRLIGKLRDDFGQSDFRLVSDEDVIFRVSPEPGTEYEPGDPTEYKLNLIRIRKGSSFEFPAVW